MKDGHSDGQAGQSGHGVSFTHICVLGHRVQLKKQRALNYLAHLEEGEDAHECQGPSSPPPLVSAPACTSVCIPAYGRGCRRGQAAPLWCTNRGTPAP